MRRRVRLFEDWPAKIVSLAAAVLIFVFFRSSTLEERFFRVPLIVTPPAGLALSAGVPPSVRIILRGEEEMISTVLERDVAVRADFGDIDSEGRFRIPLRVSRVGASINVEPLDIRVEPTEIRVSLEQQIDKTLTINPRISGTPARGFELVQFSVTPEQIVASGPRSSIQGLDTLDTDLIDLTGRKQDFAQRLGIVQNDPLISFAGAATVEFSGIIREAEIIKTFESVSIIAIDLDPILRQASALPTGSLKLSGPQVAIEDLRPQDIRLVIDCQGITEPGEYALPSQADVPPALVVLDFEPQELRLTFLRSEEGFE